jgi:hypothetical protein
MISGFKTPKHNFLSNMYPSKISTLKYSVSCAETFYQIMKTDNEFIRKQIEPLNGFESKKFWRKNGNLMKPSWHSEKLQIMRHVLYLKFFQNHDLREQLIATGDEIIVESNHWHDNYWGNCECEKCVNKHGENNLGRLLMEVREFFKN